MTQSTAAAAAAVTPIPPIIHAIGGSVGSTLSLLLLYPLERARIEMQAQTPYNFKRQEERRKGQESPENGSCLTVGGRAAGRGGNLDTCTSTSGGQESFSYELIEETQLQLEEQTKKPSEQAATHQGISQPSIRAKQPSKKKESSSSPTTSPINPSNKAPGLWSTLVNLHQNQELYRGVSPIAFTLALSNFIFFYTLQLSKGLVADYRNSKVGHPGTRMMGMGISTGATTLKQKRNSASLLASTIAGVINVLFTNPFWVANLRIVQSKESNHGLFATIHKILKTEGIAHLWNGTAASLLLVSNPAIQYYIYEHAKFELVQRRSQRLVQGGVKLVGNAMKSGSNLGPMEAFVAGAMSKAFATVVTYPLQLAQVLLRLQRGEEKELANSSCRDRSKPTLYRGTLDCIIKLYKEGGLAALYSGMNAKLIQTILTAALTFLTYEQILTIVAKSYSSLATSQ